MQKVDNATGRLSVDLLFAIWPITYNKCRLVLESAAEVFVPRKLMSFH